MAWVYILRGGRRYYIGATDNLDRRVAEHQQGSNHTTHRFGAKLELVAAKQLPSMIEARELELQLKRKKNPRLAIFRSAAVMSAPWVCRASMLLDGRMPIVPIGGLLVCVSEA
jgi:tRNA/rRNA methyltransferase